MLPVLLEKWVEQENVQKPLFVFVDDFNSPQVRDRIDFKAIARLLRNPKYYKVTWPVLVTCSPPEYLEEFQKTGGTEYFQVKKWIIPSVSKSEQEYFLEWFSLRTGELANPGLALEQDNGLVLSMMLELRHGNIVEFARRFKERLAGSNILEQMTLQLALNRLYIWAPVTWLSELTPEQQDGLSVLNLDQDFSVLNIEKSAKKYIRLTHPHLSDAIYKVIRPDSFGNQRTDDLARAFEKVVATDDVLASRILLVIAQGGDRITLDLNEKVLAEKIIVHCRTLLEIVNKSHPINLAFVWINLAKWASREPHVDKVLSTPALDTAIQILGSDHYSWGDLWLQLWACYPNDKRLSESGWLWTKNYFHWDETAWYVIWDIFLTNPDVLPDNVNKADILDVGISWLSGREDHRWWSRVWESALENDRHISSYMSADKIIRIGVEWLNGREDSGQWSFIWEDILQYAQIHNLTNTVDEMLSYGINWLDGREDQLQWAFVWQNILKYYKYASYPIDTAKLLDTGVNWIVTKENSFQWNYMWNWVINNLDKSTAAAKNTLIKWGLSWIATNQTRKKWPIVYIDLAKMKYRKDFKKIITVKDFISMGVEWAEVHKDDEEAGQVVLYLIRSYQTNFQRPDLPLQDTKLYNRLLELTNLMVRKTPINSPALPFWLLCYWEIKPTIQTGHAILKWMEITNEDSEGARSIINKLLSDQRTDVLNILIEWRQEHPHNLISEIIKSKFEKEILQQKS